MFGRINHTVYLTEKRAKAITELLKEDNIVWEDSYYGGKRFGFKISYEWLKENSELVGYKDENFDDKTHYEINLVRYFNMICNCQIINKKLALELELSENYIKMIRRSLFQYDENSNAIFLGYKRPFGNSDVIGDIMEEFNILRYDENDDEIEEDWDTKYEYLLIDVIEKIKNFLITVKIDAEMSAVYNGFDFVPTEQYLRRNKIKNVLKI